MAQNRFTINVSEVEALAGRLSQLEGRRLGGVALEAVNAVATRFEKSAIRGELANINLTEAYVRQKTDLALGTNPANPQATITTQGGLTPLGNFGGTVWFRQPGAPRRAGKVKGRRSAGVAANIRNSDRLLEGQWFVLPLRRGQVDRGNGYGVFVRKSELLGKGKNDYGPGLGDAGRRRDGKYGKGQVYGPAPYMLFRRQIAVQGPALERDLEQTVTDSLVAEIQKVVRP